MPLDSLTLMVPGAAALIFAGLFLLGASGYFGKPPALKWWAAAHLINGCALAVLTAGLSSQTPLLVMAGVGMTTITPALIWGGVRRFNNQRAPLVILAAGLVIWLATGLVPLDVDHQKWSTFVSFEIWCVYLLAAIWSLWSSREEKLNARGPLMALLAVHAMMFFGAGYEILSGAFVLDEPPRLNTFFGAVHFETILYSMGTTIFMVMMCKERVELGLIKAANVDALTGIANRSALFENAARLLKRCQQAGSPFSLIMFDLDHFKVINDTLGHQSGDRILQAFANIARDALRPSDLVGRYGGEEFAVVLPGATIETAYVIAERVRQAFARNYRFFDGQPLNATVSGGIVSASPSATLEMIFDAADKAMYAAKNAGRNRVEAAVDDRPIDGDRVIKLA